MRNAKSRLEKLEREKGADAPFIFVLGKSLERGEKPSPGAITFLLDDPMAERDRPRGQHED